MDGMGREEGSGWGTHVYLWRIHFDIWQNQYNIVKFKNKIKLKKKVKTIKVKVGKVNLIDIKNICSLKSPYEENKHTSYRWRENISNTTEKKKSKKKEFQKIQFKLHTIPPI